MVKPAVVDDLVELSLSPRGAFSAALPRNVGTQIVQHQHAAALGIVHDHACTRRIVGRAGEPAPKGIQNLLSLEIAPVASCLQPGPESCNSQVGLTASRLPCQGEEMVWRTHQGKSLHGFESVHIVFHLKTAESHLPPAVYRETAELNPDGGDLIVYRSTWNAPVDSWNDLLPDHTPPFLRHPRPSLVNASIPRHTRRLGLQDLRSPPRV